MGVSENQILYDQLNQLIYCRIQLNGGEIIFDGTITAFENLV